MKDYFDLMARILLAGCFYYEAYDSLVFFQSTQRTMTEYGITWQQDFLLVTTIVFMIIGATMVLVGYRIGLGIIFLLVYLIPITFIVYSFWNDSRDIQRLTTMMFSKNLAIAGGLIALAIHKEGRFRINMLFRAAKLSRPDWDKVS